MGVINAFLLYYYMISDISVVGLRSQQIWVFLGWALLVNISAIWVALEMQREAKETKYYFRMEIARKEYGVQNVYQLYALPESAKDYIDAKTHKSSLLEQRKICSFYFQPKNCLGGSLYS